MARNENCQELKINYLIVLVFVAEFESLNAAARKYNTKPTTISNAARGIGKTAKYFYGNSKKYEDF